MMYKFLRASLLTDDNYYLLNRHKTYIDSKESFWTVQYNRESGFSYAAFIDPIGVWHQRGINLKDEYDIRPVLHISSHFELDFGTKIQVGGIPFMVLDANKLFALEPIGTYSFAYLDSEAKPRALFSSSTDTSLYCYSAVRDVIEDWFDYFFRHVNFELITETDGNYTLNPI